MSSQDRIVESHVKDRGVQYCLLEGCRPAEISCNTDRTRLSQLIKMFRMDGKCRQVCWSRTGHHRQRFCIRQLVELLSLHGQKLIWQSFVNKYPRNFWQKFENIMRLNLYVNISWVKRVKHVKIFLWENIYIKLLTVLNEIVNMYFSWENHLLGFCTVKCDYLLSSLAVLRTSPIHVSMAVRRWLKRTMNRWPKLLVKIAQKLPRSSTWDPWIALEMLYFSNDSILERLMLPGIAIKCATHLQHPCYLKEKIYHFREENHFTHFHLMILKNNSRTCKVWFIYWTAYCSHWSA